MSLDRLFVEDPRSSYEDPIEGREAYESRGGGYEDETCRSWGRSSGREEWIADPAGGARTYTPGPPEAGGPDEAAWSTAGRREG